MPGSLAINSLNQPAFCPNTIRIRHQQQADDVSITAEKLDKTLALPLPAPAQAAASVSKNGNAQLWKQLRYLNYYRLFLAGLFLFLTLATTAPHTLGAQNSLLFYSVSTFYLFISICSAVSIRWRWLSFNTLVYCNVMLDIAAITLLMHASGGVSSGLGMLLVVAIAGGSLLMEGRTARLFAAIATLAVLAEQMYSRLKGIVPGNEYTQAGLLGASFFATAILAHVLATRLRESEALAARRGIDLANMAQLTEYIIQRMQTGIVVVDSRRRVRLINESANKLLDKPQPSEGDTINCLSPELDRQLEHWWRDPLSDTGIFHPAETAAAIIPRFARLGSDEDSGTLIFLEDTAAMSQQAQQLKLASLGRLTASIAHEVRNPLGAISHAGQLLGESSKLDQGDLRLTEIIQEQSQRVNTIIKNVMQLSRRDRSQPESLPLQSWLESFLIEFSNSEHLTAEDITLAISPEHTRVRIDPSQFHQILWNLCRNGLEHGADREKPRLILRGGLAQESTSPFLDIIDNGPGITPELIPHIFEPFFTTAEEGTGLGLYIAQELCESNQARLNYLPSDSGAHFRITFADPRRRQIS